MNWVRVVAALPIVAAELFMWFLAKRHRYGKTADGALLAAVVAWLALVLVPDVEVAGWALVLGIASTLVLLAMALDKGELK